MEDNGLKEAIKDLEKELSFYQDKSNPDWSLEKNEGFKQGINYCIDLFKLIDTEINKND